MAWVRIEIADLKDAKVAALIEACQTAALGAGQDDPTPAIIADVIARIRAEIAGCRANVLHPDAATIPSDLRSLACRMVVRQCQSRLQIALNEDEREEQRNDLRYLERIAACDIPVAAPDDGQIQAGTIAPAIAPRPRFFTKADQDGA